MIENAEKLIKDVKRKIQNSEYRGVTMKGVRNLSRSDLEMTILYAEAFVDSGGYNFGSFMSPRGNVEDLLKAYGLEQFNDPFSLYA